MFVKIVLAILASLTIFLFSQGWLMIALLFVVLGLIFKGY